MSARSTSAQSARSSPTAARRTLVLKVTLLGTEPACWRRIMVDPRLALTDLHALIQIAFDWENDHMHEFRTKLRSGAGLRRFEPLGPDAFLEPFPGTEDSRSVTVGELLGRRGAKLYYIYDFGDGWTHEIRCEKVVAASIDSLPLPPQFVRGSARAAGTSKEVMAFCEAGARRGPPEDCGGVWGYADLIRILADPKHEEHEERRWWLGLGDDEQWDPEAFDLDAVNARIATVRWKVSRSRRGSR